MKCHRACPLLYHLYSKVIYTSPLFSRSLVQTAWKGANGESMSDRTGQRAMHGISSSAAWQYRHPNRRVLLTPSLLHSTRRAYVQWQSRWVVQLSHTTIQWLGLNEVTSRIRCQNCGRRRHDGELRC